MNAPIPFPLVAQPQVNIARTVAEFGNQDDLKLRMLGYVADKISRAVYAGPSYASMLTKAEIDVMSDFLDFAAGDFALSDFTVPDTKIDQPFSPDESHFLDQEKR
jgi:hypothetical protein